MFLFFCSSSCSQQRQKVMTERASRTLDHDSSRHSQNVERLVSPKILRVPMSIYFEHLTASVNTALLFSKSFSNLGGNQGREHQIEGKFEGIV
jgi:hypothetical protein